MNYGLKVVLGCSAQRNAVETKCKTLMAAKLWETARKLPPGVEQHALLEQIGTFRTKLSAVAAKRKQLQSAE
jgi:hypothetical protein